MARLDSSIFPALNDKVLAQLHSSDIYTAYDFLEKDCDVLMRKTGFTFKEIEKMREVFFAKFGGEITNAFSLHERELARGRISTGIQNLDALLEGGLRCGAIYEICGSSSAGKSQLCHWLSMHATASDSAEVHYIDGSRNFCATRIQMMLGSRHSNDNMIVGKVMSNIKVYQVCKIYELFSVFHSLSNEDRSDSSRRLIIVDSLAALCALLTKEEFNELLSNFASVCRYIVSYFEAAILIVNTVITEQAGTFSTGQDGVQNFTPKIRPSLGNYWLGVPNVRLLMTQEENGQRKIAVWKSQQLEPDNSCLVRIKDEGIFPS